MSLESLPLLADFTAAIRRPRPVAGGLVAELFASNGPDADQALQLGLSAHQDATVDVDIRDEAGECVGGFVAALRRPIPRQSGMVACFHADNGDNADAIAALSLSKRQDQRVRVQVRLVKLPDGSEPAKPKGPYRGQAAILFRSDFLGNPSVWAAAGTDEDYLEWLRVQPCCCGKDFGVHGGDVVAAHVRRVADGAGTGIKPPYSAVPLCCRHHDIQHGGESAFGGKSFFDRERIKHLRLWVWHCLREAAGVESMAFAPPSVVRQWAQARGVLVFMPEGYQ